MSLTLRTLIGLAAGLALGILAAVTGDPMLARFATIVEPVGALWVGAIRMTVVPLVVSLLLVGIASTEARSIGRLGLWTTGFYCVLVPLFALITALLVLPIAKALPLGAPPLAAAAAGPPAAVEAPGLAGWVAGLVPANPIGAAADGAMIPLIVFTVVLGLALTRLPAATSAPVLAFFRGLGDAMLVIVRWVLVAGPVGVFALSLSMSARMGVDAAGTVLTYVLLVSALLVAGTLALYPIARLGGGIPLRRFAGACLSPQAVALTTRSSLASLPAMLDSAEKQLALPVTVTRFVLPFAVSIFKLSTPIALTTGAICFGRMYGVNLGAAQIGTIVVSAFLMNVATPGIPNGGPLVYAPAFVALGIPIEAIGLLLAVDAVPDVFKTVINVTGHMTAAVVLAPRVPVPVPATAAAGVPGGSVLVVEGGV